MQPETVEEIHDRVAQRLPDAHTTFPPSSHDATQWPTTSSPSCSSSLSSSCIPHPPTPYFHHDSSRTKLLDDYPTLETFSAPPDFFCTDTAGTSLSNNLHHHNHHLLQALTLSADLSSSYSYCCPDYDDVSVTYSYSELLDSTTLSIPTLSDSSSGSSSPSSGPESCSSLSSIGPGPSLYLPDTNETSSLCTTNKDSGITSSSCVNNTDSLSFTNTDTKDSGLHSTRGRDSTDSSAGSEQLGVTRTPRPQSEVYALSSALFQVIRKSGAGDPGGRCGELVKHTRQRYGNYAYVTLSQGLGDERVDLRQDVTAGGGATFTGQPEH